MQKSRQNKRSKRLRKIPQLVKTVRKLICKSDPFFEKPVRFRGDRRREGVSIPLETTAATWWKTIGPWKENWTESRGKSATLRLQFSPQGRSKIRRGGENPSPFDALSAMRIRHDHGSALDAATRFRSHVYHANY